MNELIYFIFLFLLFFLVVVVLFCFFEQKTQISEKLVTFVETGRSGCFGRKRKFFQNFFVTQFFVSRLYTVKQKLFVYSNPSSARLSVTVIVKDKGIGDPSSKPWISLFAFYFVLNDLYLSSPSYG